MHFRRNILNTENTISMCNDCSTDDVEQCVHLGTIIYTLYLYSLLYTLNGKKTQNQHKHTMRYTEH